MIGLLNSVLKREFYDQFWRFHRKRTGLTCFRFHDSAPFASQSKKKIHWTVKIRAWVNERALPFALFAYMNRQWFFRGARWK